MMAALIAATVVTTSCSKDEEAVSDPKGPATINLSASADNMTVTKASDLPMSTKVGVSFTKNGAKHGDDNYAFVSNGGNLTTSATMPAWVGGDVAQVYAYAPKAENFLPGGYSISAVRGNDYVLAKSTEMTLVTGSNTVNLPFTHAGSQFTLRLVKAEGAAITDDELAKVTLKKVEGLAPSAVWDTRSGKFSSLVAATDLVPTPEPIVNGMSAINIIPTEGPATLTFTFSGDWNGGGAAEITGNLNRQFKAGESYLITVTVNKAGTVLGATLSLTATLQDWVTVNDNMDIVEPA